jgi:hypothetical protein
LRPVIKVFIKGFDFDRKYGLISESGRNQAHGGKKGSEYGGEKSGTETFENGKNRPV